MNPTDSEYLLTHALAAYVVGNYDDALASIKLAKDSGSQSLALLFVKAGCLKGVGKNEAALQAYREAHDTLQESEGVDHQHLMRGIVNNFAADRIVAAPQKITVTTLADESNGIADGKVSLREAVFHIRDGGTVDFDVKGTIELKFGPIWIDKSVTITGPGRDQLTIDGENKYRLMILEDGNEELAQIAISGLHLTKGRNNDSDGPECIWTESRGCIFNGESLEISDCLLDQNHIPSGSGGAIHSWTGLSDENECYLKVTRCTFVGNSADYGGAIICGSGGSVIESCTFVGNQSPSGYGGAIQHTSGTLSVVNSTFADNASQDRGAVLLNVRQWNDVVDTVRIDHCTFSGNVGGAILSRKYPLPPHAWDIAVSNCILTGNVDQAGKPLDVVSKDGVQARISYSIIGVSKGGFIDEGNNQIGVDPKLGPLANNGGPTKTFALLEDSAAIDAGADSTQEESLENDQRGNPFSRSVDGDGSGTSAPDMGAFEKQ